MKLTDILTRECVCVPLKASEKTEAITELADILAEHKRITDRDPVLQAVLERERAASTGIGQGLAVPHGKSAGCTELVMAVGKPATPMDFDSKDGKPVEIVALLASPPDKTGPHIQALAQIARLMLLDRFRAELAQAQTADELYEIIRHHEE